MERKYMIYYSVDVKTNDNDFTPIVLGARFNTLNEAKLYCESWQGKPDIAGCSIYKIDTSVCAEDPNSANNCVYAIDYILFGEKPEFLYYKF